MYIQNLIEDLKDTDKERFDSLEKHMNEMSLKELGYEYAKKYAKKSVLYVYTDLLSEDFLFNYKLDAKEELKRNIIYKGKQTTFTLEDKNVTNN